jgi:hypothetical protein
LTTSPEANIIALLENDFHHHDYLNKLGGEKWSFSAATLGGAISTTIPVCSDNIASAVQESSSLAAQNNQSPCFRRSSGAGLIGA